MPSSPDRRWTRAALAAGALIGAANVPVLWDRKPGYLGVDYRVYELAGRAALAGDAPYGASPPGFGFEYVYPPASALVFAPLAALPGWRPAFVLFTLTAVAAGIGVVWLCESVLRSAGIELQRADRALLGGYVLLSPAAAQSFFFGQVNLHLALALGGGLVALERHRGWLAGALLAVPAYVKAFPAAVGVWLVRRRAWRAVAAAVGSGLAAYAVGVALYGPDAVRTYVETALLDRLDSGTATVAPTDLYVTLRRPASLVFDDGTLIAVVPVLVLAPVLAVLYQDCSTPTRRLAAAHGTVVAVLLVFPSYPLYLVFLYPTLLSLLYPCRGWPRRLFAAGTLLIAVPYTVRVPRELFAAVSLPGAVESGVLAVATPLLSAALPPLYGSLSTLVGCLLVVRRPAAAGSRRQA